MPCFYNTIMVDDDFSCIKTVTRIVHIALPSVHVSNEVIGVSEVLESWKRQYIQQLQGVVVSYKNVALASKSGFMVIDKPCVYYDVKATFELFCPTIGSIVKGKINRVSYDYIGCLIHDTINVTIQRSYDASDGLSKFIALDCIVLFKITCFDFHQRVIHVKGEITEECVRLMKELSPFNSQSNIFQDSQSTYLSTSELSDDTTSFIRKDDDDAFGHCEDESPSLLVPKFYQNNDLNIFNVDHLADKTSTGVSSTSHESDSSSLVQNTKKKSKKHKSKKKVDQENDIEEAIEIPYSIDDFVSPTKKKKKHKDKIPKDKSSKDTEVPKSPSKRKSNKVDHLVPSQSSLDNTTSDIEIETTNEVKNLQSPKKKKSSKKSVKNACTFHEFLSPKKHSDASSSVSSTFLTDISIKKEIPSDSGYRSPSPKKKKSKKQKNDDNVAPNNIEDILDVVSAFEPSLDDQLLIPQATSSNTKQEPEEANQKEKKRKRESTSNEGLPTKKRKTKVDQDNSRDKPHKKGKKKKKDKKKSNKGSKKDKNKKPKGKLSKSKKDQLSYKIKHKKNKESKIKKKKKSSKDKTKKVPFPSPAKSE